MSGGALKADLVTRGIQCPSNLLPFLLSSFPQLPQAPLGHVQCKMLTRPCFCLQELTVTITGKGALPHSHGPLRAAGSLDRQRAHSAQWFSTRGVGEQQRLAAVVEQSRDQGMLGLDSNAASTSAWLCPWD